MTDEFTNAPEEITKDNIEETKQAAKTPEQSSDSDNRPMSKRELLERGLMILQMAAEDDSVVAERYRELINECFGPEVSEEEARNASVDDERQCELICKFLDSEISEMKSDVISLDHDKIDGAFKGMFGLMDIKLKSDSSYDDEFEKRSSLIPEILDEYEIFKLNRSVYEAYRDKSGTLNINGIVMEMEKRYSQKDITREQLAKFYYNIGCVYDVNSLNKIAEKRSKDEYLLSLNYKRQALAKTKTNMELILNVYRDWHTHQTFDSDEILNACHRVIDNSGDKRNLCMAHKLYAETLRDFRGTDGFGDKRTKRVSSIVDHYRKAVNYTQNREEKIDILEIISDVQKNVDKPGYIRTRMELASMLNYRDRIREYNNLIDKTDKVAEKMFMCKAGINEFYDLQGIDDEDRQLYDEIDAKFRKVVNDNGGDPKIISKLNSLKKKYGTVDSKNKEPLFVQMSTSGHDFFSPEGR